MAQVINTNTMSLNAQRNLSTSGSSLSGSGTQPHFGQLTRGIGSPQ